MDLELVAAVFAYRQQLQQVHGGGGCQTGPSVSHALLDRFAILVDRLVERGLIVIGWGAAAPHNPGVSPSLAAVGNERATRSGEPVDNS